MSAKYYRNGTRTYYQVKGDHVIQIINKLTHSYVTASDAGFLIESALEGKEITRDEFKKQFEEASRLIVLEE